MAVGPDHAAWNLAPITSASGPRAGAAEAVEIHDVLRESVEMISRILGPRIRFEPSLGDAPKRVDGDRSHLRHLLLNLAIHAHDAMPGGGVMTVRTRRVRLDRAAARMAGLAVGPYVELEIAEYARRARPLAAPRAPGIAPCVHDLVARHQGRIRLRQEPGGSAFLWVLLPEAQRDVTAPRRRPHPLRRGVLHSESSPLQLAPDPPKGPGTATSET